MNKRTICGFTVVELLVVVSIIAILGSVIYPRLQNARDKAQVANAQVELDAINKQIGELYNDTNVYPNGATSLCRTSLPSGNEVDLAATTSGLLGNGSGWSGWNGPYIETVEDPWGLPYYLDEDYQCLASTTGCNGVTDSGNDSSVLVSCGPNTAQADGACAYDGDNIVFVISCN